MREDPWMSSGNLQSAERAANRTVLPLDDSKGHEPLSSPTARATEMTPPQSHHGAAGLHHGTTPSASSGSDEPTYQGVGIAPRDPGEVLHEAAKAAASSSPISGAAVAESASDKSVEGTEAGPGLLERSSVGDGVLGTEVPVTAVAGVYLTSVAVTAYLAAAATAAVQAAAVTTAVTVMTGGSIGARAPEETERGGATGATSLNIGYTPEGAIAPATAGRAATSASTSANADLPTREQVTGGASVSAAAEARNSSPTGLSPENAPLISPQNPPLTTHKQHAPPHVVVPIADPDDSSTALLDINNSNPTVVLPSPHRSEASSVASAVAGIRQICLRCLSFLYPKKTVGSVRQKYANVKAKVNKRHCWIVPSRASNCGCLWCLFFCLVLLAIGGLIGVLVLVGVFKRGTPALVILYQAAGAPAPSGLPAADICTGPCCSNLAPTIYKGEGYMPSFWWNNKLQHNAQIQLQGVASQAWIGAYGSSGWLSGTPQELAALTSTSEPPSPLQVFTVRRVSPTLVRLLAPNGLFVALQANGSITASASDSSSGTAFTVVQVGTSQVQLLTPSGLALANTGVLGPLLEAITLPLASRNTTLFNVRETMAVPALRAVNLGGWLVLEEWMAPPLFTNVPANMDGTVVQLQSVAAGTWMGLSSDGDGRLVCLASVPSSWETFHVRRPQGPAMSTFQFRVESSTLFWQASQGYVYAINETASPYGLSNFTVHFSPSTASSAVLLQAATGYFVAVNAAGNVTVNGTVSAADLADASSSVWSSALSFVWLAVSKLQGEWQLSAGLTPATTAAAVLQEHRKSFITEADFKWMKKAGLNAARLPVGYWAAQGAQPDPPFVAGSLTFVDLAMKWGETYGIRILLSLHAAAGSQNPFAHSASRDGIPDFADSSGSNLNTTLDAIGFFAQRYSQSSAFLGIDLLNEPTWGAVPDLAVLQSFYSEGYARVRQYSSCAFVAIQAHVDGKSSELDGFMTDGANFSNVILDMHEYNEFNTAVFGGQSVAFNLDYVLTTRKAAIAEASQGSRLAMIGEWSLALLSTANATSTDYAKFGQLQLAVYGTSAGAGWAFWAYTLEYASALPNWSFRQSVTLGWLQLVGGSTFW
eukprot:TRINITY_DN2060_c0_g1_i1.p1 TRINITY_DN2060_c0_g1~~TRINITY_DN2060_c0_g1_i1.p1  ORF type:complete len:1105 (-),score=190.63 TRINITY_DN2060_c0_g1_i1:172-3486(-)